MMGRIPFGPIGLLAVLLGALPLSAQMSSQVSSQSPPSSRSLTVPADSLRWRQQAPDLPTRITDLWGNREADGGFGQLISLPPGFNSGLHAHSGDFHGVLVKGVWVHEGPRGEGKDVRLLPGSYVRQAGGEMHVDRCVSEEPCLLFTFQYARADIIWPSR